MNSVINSRNRKAKKRKNKAAAERKLLMSHFTFISFSFLSQERKLSNHFFQMCLCKFKKSVWSMWTNTATYCSFNRDFVFYCFSSMKIHKHLLLFSSATETSSHQVSHVKLMVVLLQVINSHYCSTGPPGIYTDESPSAETQRSHIQVDPQLTSEKPTNLLIIKGIT